VPEGPIDALARGSDESREVVLRHRKGDPDSLRSGLSEPPAELTEHVEETFGNRVGERGGEAPAKHVVAPGLYEDQPAGDLRSSGQHPQVLRVDVDDARLRQGPDLGARHIARPQERGLPEAFARAKHLEQEPLILQPSPRREHHAVFDDAEPTSEVALREDELAWGHVAHPHRPGGPEVGRVRPRGGEGEEGVGFAHHRDRLLECTKCTGTQ
jgi:hypothetical protein